MDKTARENSGHNEYFEREFRKRKLPFISSFDMGSYLEEMSGSKLSGGIIKSKDGKLVFNLDEGTLKYSGVSVI